MALKATTVGGGDFPQPPKGNHRAVCVAVIDTGHQYYQYKARNDKEKDKEGWRPTVYLVWELLGKKNEKGEPWLVGKQFTNSCAGENSHLRPVYEALVGPIPKGAKDVNTGLCLGKPCMVDIRPDEGNPKYMRVKAVATALDEDIETPPKPRTKLFLFDIDEGKELIGHEWPYIYGKPVGVVVSESRERKTSTGRQEAAEGAEQEESEVSV